MVIPYLDTVVQVVEIVQKTIEIYNKIRDGPEQIKKIARRLKRLEDRLGKLERHLHDNSRTALARLKKAQAEELFDIIKETRDDCQVAYDLFRKWDDNIGPLGFQWRFRPVGEIFFTLGSSADKLEDCAKDIEEHQKDIDRYLGYMGVVYMGMANEGIQNVLKSNEQLAKENAEIKKQLALLSDGIQGLLMQPLSPGLSPALNPAKSPSPKLQTAKLVAAEKKEVKKKELDEIELDKREPAKKALEKKEPPKKTPDIKIPSNNITPKTQADSRDEKQSQKRPPKPSPSPSPPRRDYSIVFIDPLNIGRGPIVASLTKLLKEWTVRTGGDWRIAQIDSRGFFVRKDSDCIQLIEGGGMHFSHKSYKLDMKDGGVKVKATAVSALFDNKNYDYPFKKTVRKSIDGHVSRGVRRSMFASHDFILVFTGREHDNMLNLRKAVVEADGRDAAPKGKGKIIHLGRYLTKTGIPREIIDPAQNADGSDSKENWLAKVGQLKSAMKGFLKQELAWEQPSSTAVVKS